MADFSSLKQTIRSYVKQNGNEEITGNILQDVLLAMVSTMGDSAINSLASALQDETTARQNQDGTLQGNITAETTARQQADTALGGRIDGLQTAVNSINTKLAEGYIYAGIATPSTNPGTPSGKLFYIAVSSGTYTNFSNLTVAQGINILKYNGSAWSKDVVYAIDARPKKNSQNLVTSGGVFDNIGALDVSELNATENPHTLAQYDGLSAALAAIPTDYQKGGMSIKFVQSSDNKYVQYRLMNDEWSTTVTDWQGIDDVPTAGSKNLVESSGIVKYTKENYSKVEKAISDDLEVVDDNDNTLAEFSGGHIKTQKFDSSAINGEYISEHTIGDEKLKNIHSVVEESIVDFSISDENGNIVFEVADGFPHTQNFNGNTIATQAKDANDFAFGLKTENLNDHHEVMAKIAGLTKRTPLAVTYNTGGNKPLVLLHFSDIHNAHFELSRVKSFKDAYADYIDDVLSTGDNLYDQITDSFPWGEYGAGGFLNTIGNHDAANGGSIATAQECYNKEFKDFIADWGVEYTEGLCYYYKDYDDSKVRLIVLDCMHFDDTQKAWFANVLDDARTHTSNGESDPYAVVVANHYQIEDTREATFVESTFCSKMFRDEYFSFTSGAAAIVDAFQNNGGEFVCWLTGHTHKDYMTKPVGYPNQLVITIDSINPYALESDTQRIMGTKSQDLFNLVAINTTGKTVSLARIGADYDVYMRHKGVFCWDYANHQIVFNN